MPVRQRPRHDSLQRSLLSGIAFVLIGMDAGFAADRPQGILSTVDGQELEGVLLRLDGEGADVQSGDGRVVHIPRSDLRQVLLPAGPFRNHDRQPWLLFANGDRAAVTVEGISEDQLQCRWTQFPSQEPWNVPLEELRGAIIQPPELERDRSDLVREVSTVSFGGDILKLIDGGRLTGELQASGDEGFVIATSVGAVTVAPDRVRSLALNSALVSATPSPAEHVLVTLRDGSWLTCSELRLMPEGSFSTRTAFGAEFQFEAGLIAQLDFFGDRVQILSQSSPIRESIVRYIGPGPLTQVNRNVRGGFLQLRDREYPRGLGMLSGTSATWRLTDRDRRFQVQIGLDDRSAGGGSVEFIIELDGRMLFSSGLVRGADPPISVGPLDIAGGSELTLRVAFGEFGNSRDFANWCHPLLLH